MSDREGRLWRDRRFVTYWAGQAVSELGDRVSELAVPLIAVTMLHAGAIEVGVLTAAVWAPNLLSLLTGAWVDQRARKQRLLVASDLVQALAVITVPLAYWTGVLTLGQLVVVALVAGAGRTIYQTAYPSFFVALVRRDQYLQANSLLSTTRSGSFIVGPAVGGVLIQVLTAPVAMVVDAVSFLASATLIRQVRVDELSATSDAGEGGLWRRARDGMRYLWSHPYMSASLRCCTTLNFFSFVVSALTILYASRVLGLSAGVIGLAFGVGSFGGLAGAVLAPRVGRLLGVGRTVALGCVLFSAPFAAVPLAAGPTWSRAAVLAAVEAVSGVGVMLFDVNLNAVQTAVTADEMRSRVSGAFSTVNYGIRPLGALVGGVAGDLVGVGPTMVAAAVGGSLSLLWLVRSPIFGTASIEDLSPTAVPSAR
ncbi:MFS transporter [Luteipulveratus sp. YIM 133132]|uniref:MFS transporter n=1 Tax=Luteipulveratus flavus TaxID=3031728 RepID=A0ABT6C972_9MICO|nr:MULTISPECIES: MFS transporter [unclassified Luteipulveratus]MDE9365070.1 MFS transporter [Luteipulveratus sp. YIM 133132]MDF8264594.1 MFS transporter [Luteipulveratus sp. YIM 133296]